MHSTSTSRWTTVKGSGRGKSQLLVRGFWNRLDPARDILGAESASHLAGARGEAHTSGPRYWSVLLLSVFAVRFRGHLRLGGGIKL